jgi:hypothetical protein
MDIEHEEAIRWFLLFAIYGVAACVVHVVKAVWEAIVWAKEKLDGTA